MFYLLVAFILFLVFTIYGNIYRIRSLKLDENMFEGRFYNLLYKFSYTYPLNKFLDKKGTLNKRERKISQELKELDLNHKFSLRTFLGLRLLLLFVPLFIIITFMFYLRYFTSGFNFAKELKWLIIPVILAYLPDLYLVKKKLDYEEFNFNEVVILQMFMLLLIKSNSTIEDILYAFSKMETYHKRTFEKAYRISLRGKTDALEFLQDKFAGTVFGSSFKILDEMFMYSKEDSVRILKANLKTIQKESLKNKTKKELTKFSYSQISIIVPFAVAIFLGAIPLIQYGISMMTDGLLGV